VEPPDVFPRPPFEEVDSVLAFRDSEELSTDVE